MLVEDGYEGAVRYHLGDRDALTVGPSGGHDHEIRNGGLAGEVDGDCVLGLHFVGTGEDEAKNLACVRTHLGGSWERAAHADPGDRRCGQGTFLSFRST